MTDKIEKELEVGTGAGAVEKMKKTDYNKIVEGLKKENLGDQEAEEARKNAEGLLQQIKEENEKQVNTKIAHETGHTSQRKDGEQRKKENPGEANANRVKEGENLISEINAPQSNIIAKGLQRIIKTLGGF